LIIFRLIGLITCPLGALLGPLESLTWSLALERDAFYIEVVIAFLITVGIALLILGLTLVTFNRSMGRMPERVRRGPLRPRPLRTPREPHIPRNGSRVRAQLQQRT
jgi:hypothetical protein